MIHADLISSVVDKVDQPVIAELRIHRFVQLKICGEFDFSAAVSLSKLKVHDQSIRRVFRIHLEVDDSPEHFVWPGTTMVW
jgi:hypothetical protein